MNSNPLDSEFFNLKNDPTFSSKTNLLQLLFYSCQLGFVLEYIVFYDIYTNNAYGGFSGCFGEYNPLESDLGIYTFLLVFFNSIICAFLLRNRNRASIHPNFIFLSLILQILFFGFLHLSQ